MNKKIKKRFKPYIRVNVGYETEDDEDYNAYDDKFKTLAEKYDGEHAGSGYGCGSRDIAFVFYDLKNAASFAKTILKRKSFTKKGVIEVSSSSNLHEDDF